MHAYNTQTIIFTSLVAVSRDPSSRLLRLKTLFIEAERDLYRLKAEFASQNASNNSGIKDAERRYKRGERRVHLYSTMLRNYERAGKTLVENCLAKEWDLVEREGGWDQLILIDVLIQSLDHVKRSLKIIL